ncbi:MAG: replication initiation protein [Lachnospiraceae bacterium]|nr:replication initiation protein [Lachnospiraceae bacterium]
MNQYEPLENLSLQKSNSLVSAKYKSSLVENQIMAIALTRIEVNATEEGAPIVAKLWPGELKRLIGDPTNIYKTLKKVSKTMTGHTMFLEDGKGNFKAFAVVNNADYIDGVFTVEFNKNLREHVLGLERNYTSFELAVLTQFKKNSSFRIYELLKSHLYKSKPSVNNGRVDVEYNISELRFMIGLANGDDPSVKNAMAGMGNNIDWDVMYSKLDKKDKKYETWFDFQRYVIKPAQEELEEKSNLRFDYEGVREGRRMGRIRFFVYPNNPMNKEVIDERREFIDEEKAKTDRQYELPRDLPEYRPLYDEFVGHNDISAEDMDLLIKQSGYDTDLVRLAISQADEQAGIDNYIGWIVACIKAGGYTKTEVVEGSHEKAVAFKNLHDAANSDDTKKRVWENTKKKEDFEIFLAYEESVKQISFIELDEILEPAESVAEYIAWRKAGKPTA